MEGTKEEKAKTIIDNLTALLGMEKEVVTLDSELADGEYVLEDGTKFTITDGNVMDVVAPDPEAAEAEEAAKREEDEVALAAHTKATEDLATALAKVTELEAEVVTLSKEPKKKKVVVAPKSKVLERIELTANMTHSERVTARLFNTLNKV